MPQNFLSCERDQVMLLPPDMSEWLPAGHLARFVLETVEQLDLAEIYGAYRADGHGRSAHDPGMMTALLLYAYAVGVRSSRQIERRCVEDVAFRVIAANRAPDHVTISRFRARHQDALSALFFGVLGLCRQAGMVQVGVVAIDSTKLAADASPGANRTERGLRAEAQRIFEEAAAIDAQEDELYGDQRGDELPAELADPATRKARIKELLDQAEAARQEQQDQRDAHVKERRAAREAGKGGRPPSPALTKHQQRLLRIRKYNLTDPDSGIVRHRGMLLQGYNIQTAVADGQIILAARATGAPSDGGQLVPVLEHATHNLSRLGHRETIGEVLADTGYWHAEQISEIQDRGIHVLVPPKPLPAGRQDRQPQAVAMRAELDTDHGADRYRRRQQIVEPVFAHIKHTRGIGRMLRRRLAGVQAEIDLIATTHNLLKLYRHTPATA